MEAADWRDDEMVGAWSNLLRLHARLVPAIDAELQRATGLSLGWYDVLLELNAAPERRLRMLDLGEAVVLSRTRVSRVVDELERAGHVARIPNPDDGRSAFASLTPSGRALLRKAAPVYLEAIRRQLGSRISVRDARELRRILEGALLSADPA